MSDDDEKKVNQFAEFMTALAMRLIVSAVLVGLALKYGPAWALLAALCVSIVWSPMR